MPTEEKLRTMSPEWAVMTAPDGSYARLARDGAEITPLRSLRRPALVALLLGTVVSMAAANSVDIRLVVSTTLCWSVVPALQVVAALLLVASVPRRAVPMPRALDLLFMTHGPWSIWLLAYAANALVATGASHTFGFVLLSTLVPAIWTGFLVAAFCRQVLRTTAREARRRTLAHQGFMLGSVLVYFGWAVAIWPRVVGGFQLMFHGVLRR